MNAVPVAIDHLPGRDYILAAALRREPSLERREANDSNQPEAVGHADVLTDRFWPIAPIRSAVLEPCTSPFQMAMTIFFGITVQ